MQHWRFPLSVPLASLVRPSGAFDNGLTDLLNLAGLQKQSYEGGFLPADAFVRLIGVAIRSSQDEYCGLGATPGKPGLFQMMSNVAFQARDGFRGLEIYRDFYNITRNDIFVTVCRTRDEVKISIASDVGDRESRSAFEELHLIGLYNFLCWFCDADMTLRRLTMRRSKAEGESPFHPLFQTFAQWNQSDTSLSVSYSDLLRPRAIRTNDGALWAQLSRSSERLGRLDESVRKPRSEPALISKLKSTIKSEGDNSEVIASRLNMSESTLRRRLRSCGTSVRQLKNELLQEQAIKLLILDRCTVQEVADELGFSEASSFRRAFKAWTGLSPQRYCEFRSHLGDIRHLP